jgi:DegV family protein with EDD domain
MPATVVTDSTSYIPSALRRELDIRVVMLTTTLDGVTYADDSEDCDAFFSALTASRSFAHSSLPSVESFVTAFERVLGEGRDVVCVLISRQLSGTFDAAMLARDLVMESRPDAVIEMVDGKSNSMELGFAVLAAARAAAAGAPTAEVAAAAVEMTRHSRFLFTPLTLEYLRRGGRIGGAAAVLGALLQVRPVLTAEGGKTAIFAKVRSVRRAHDTILHALASDLHAHGGLGDVVVQHIAAADVGRRFAERVSVIAGRAVEVLPVGPVVGTHVGPGTVGIAYHTVGRLR